jgi:hypothetical protein
MQDRLTEIALEFADAGEQADGRWGCAGKTRYSLQVLLTKNP